MTRSALTALFLGSSLAGLATAAAVAAVQEELPARPAVTLSGATIAPAPLQGEAFGEAVRREIDDRAAVARGSNRAHILVFFNSPPTAEQRGALARIGVTLQKRTGPLSFSATASQTGAARLGSIGGVAGGALIPPAAKIAPEAALAPQLDYLQREDGLAFTLVFHEDVAFGEAVAVAERAGARIEEGTKESFESFPSLAVVLKNDRLEALAGFDAVRFIEPAPPAQIDYNRLNTQPLSNVDDVQIAPYGLSGAGVTVGVWEAGDIVRPTHQDLTPRVTVQPGQTTSQDGHALHVAGTIGASGVNTPNAEGMAPAVNILSWDAAVDDTEMRNASDPANPLLVASNHSYGLLIGGGNNFLFGDYSADSEAMDDVVFDNGLVVLKAAGNDRNDPGDCQQNNYPGGADGDCIGPFGVAKNVITVGAMNGAGAIAAFSSFGPSDDGRIKPDLVAHGVNVLSLGRAVWNGAFFDDDVPQTNTDVWTASGTSMATPAVTGITALLFEEAEDLGIALDADSVKALLIQTAQDVAGVGQAQAGPDFATGWGIADAQAAVDLLRQPGGPGLAQDTLSGTGVANAYVLPFFVPAGQPEMHVTLAWSDPAGDPALPAASPQLVNDLDLRLIAPDGTTIHQPWTLNPADPGQAAVRNGGDDSVNPVEQVSVLNPAGGVWYARVAAKAGSLVAGPQDFALAGPFLPQSGPIASEKRNLMLVLDRSGSMNLPSSVAGVSKLQAMRNAAKAFTDFIEIVGGHNLGMVQFNSNTVPLSPLFDLQPLDAASSANAHVTIDNINGGGLTNIIAGITDAEAAFGTPAATNPADAIVLFSDGRHNSPWGSDVATIDTIMANDTKFFGIGFGTDVDSSVMTTVAANHDGLWVEEQELNGAELSKLFLLAGGLAIDQTIVLDPDYLIAPGNTVYQNVYVTKQDADVTFAVTWNEPEAEKLSFSLTGPSTRCFLPDSDHPGYKTRQGPGYKLIRVALPYSCLEGSTERLHEGLWSLGVRNDGRSDASVKVLTFADSDIQLLALGALKGNDAVVSANLMAGGTIATLKDAQVTAHVPMRLPPQADSMSEDEEGSRLGEPVGGEGFDPGLKIVKVALNDDGQDGDEVAGDGVFGGRVPYDPRTAIGQVRIVAEGDYQDRPIRREAVTSFSVTP